MRNRNQSGFTLVEVTIILLVLVILSTIMLPQLGNYNRLARFVKVTEDLGALCASMKKMLDESMDSAFWGNPTNRTDPIGLLYGTGDVPAVDLNLYADTDWATASTPGTTLAVDVLTDIVAGNPFETFADSFDNHLQRNTPFAGGHYTDKTDFTGALANEWWAMGWSGPYFNKIQPDAWGNRYQSNVFGLHSTPAGDYFLGAVIVISAGPNETIETPFDMYPTHVVKGVDGAGPGYEIGGDDLVCVLSAGGPF